LLSYCLYPKVRGRVEGDVETHLAADVGDAALGDLAGDGRHRRSCSAPPSWVVPREAAAQSFPKITAGIAKPGAKVDVVRKAVIWRSVLASLWFQTTFPNGRQFPMST
jgi:hypothetical protein